VPPAVLLLIAIAVEVCATAALPRTKGFTEPGWAVFVVAGYATAAWLLAVVVRRMDVSVVYAVWAGLGTAAIAVIGWLWLGDTMTPVKAGGLALIVAGVVLVNLQGVAH
jgi:small multidrug resistance pump